MTHLHDLTIKKFHEGLLDKEFSAAEAVRNFFKWIDEKDKEIGAYLHLARDEAYLQAEQADLAIAKGEKVGLLAGAPLAVKDNILISGLPCSAASKILQTYKAVYDASVIGKLRQAKAVFLGKTNLDEFAMGSSTENSAFQLTRNPHDLERVPGGSSGGSAAAVAAHMAVAALGSDTGGSIRQPADFCQVVGLKPTYGAVSRYGLMAMASSLDQIGPLTKTVEDAAILFQTIAGQDSFDATSAAPPSGQYDLSNPKLERIREMIIGLPKEYFVSGLEEKVEKRLEQVISQLKTLKIKFKEISLPHSRYALSCYYIIMPAEVSANLARYDGVRYVGVDRSAGFGAEVKRRIILGTFVLSSGYYDAYYAQAQKVRQLIKEDFQRAFKQVDLILTPVSPTLPFKIGERVNDPLQMYLSDVLTIPANLAGLPALTVPPGFQLIGKPWREADILGVGQYYERISQ